MRITLASLVREPMLLFFAAGAALFAVAPRAERTDQIHLSARSLRSLEDAEARRRNLPALPADAAAALRNQTVDDELLYREGLRLGVDKNDNIVRQRVIEKMLFLAEDLAGSAPPISDAELQRYFDAHTNEFRKPALVSFVQVYAASDPVRLQRLRGTLPAGIDGGTPSAGDAFPLGRRVIDATRESIRARYGDALAAAAESLPLGLWSEVIASSYGHHLIKVTARREAALPALGEVRAQVRLAYVQERKSHATAAFRQAVRARYQVTIDDAADAAPAARAFAVSAAAAAAREAD